MGTGVGESTRVRPKGAPQLLPVGPGLSAGGGAHIAVGTAGEMQGIIDASRAAADPHHVNGLFSFQQIEYRTRAGAQEAQEAPAVTPEAPQELTFNQNPEIREAAGVNAPPPAFQFLAPGLKIAFDLSPEPLPEGIRNYVLEQRGLRSK